MSETKLPDIVCTLDRMVTADPHGLHTVHLIVGMGQAIIDAKAEITRLRAHAGWHEAIDPEALEAARRIVDARPIEREAVYLHEALTVARALLPPGGEKG